MAKRTSSGQSKHDAKVRQTARQLQGQGWKVEADVRGFPSPAAIGKGKRVPDVVASKGGRHKIIEVETPDTLKTDKEQHAAFRRSAAQRRNTSFNIEVAK